RVILLDSERGRARPGVVLARGIPQGDIEIVQMHDDTTDCRASGRGNLQGNWLGIACDAPTATKTESAREKELLLQHGWFVFPPYTSEVAAGRVAFVAAAGAIEVFLPSLSIAGEDVDHLRIGPATQGVGKFLM